MKNLVHNIDVLVYSAAYYVIQCYYILDGQIDSQHLVPRPPDTNIVRCMWLFHHKYLADGTLSRYKAHLVANGSTQLEWVDVDETFSPVVKLGTIRTVLIYMHQPLGFRDSVNLSEQNQWSGCRTIYAFDIIRTSPRRVAGSRAAAKGGFQLERLAQCNDYLSRRGISFLDLGGTSS
ncbi:ribonuclease H-like domain-containing protein [Tanacetum coccineum]